MKALKVAPTNVLNAVVAYFKRELPKYEVVSVLRKHAETALDNDSNLFFVIAKGHNTISAGRYCCWTCWNESNQSLNYGHYWIDLEDCFRLALEQCASLPLTYESKSGLFIKTDEDLLDLPRGEYSFLVNELSDLPTGAEAFTLNRSPLIVIALKTE